MKKSLGLTYVRQLCSLPLAGPALAPAILRSLREVVSFDSAGFFWVDGRGDMINMYAERMLPPALIRRYFLHHYEVQPHSFRDSFNARLAAATSVGQVSAEGSLSQSDYFKEILEPLDVYRILYCIVRDGHRPIGQLSLYRSQRTAPFSSVDAEALEGTARYLAHGLGADSTSALSSVVSDAWRDSGLEALLLCDEDGEVESASYRAFALLAHASGEAINQTTMRGSLDRAGRSLLRKVVSQIDEQRRHNDVPAERTVDNQWGRYRLRGYSLNDGRFGVIVQRQEHLLVRLVDAMRTLSLSAQQREAALLLAQGLSNQELAAHMGVSINTASYHVKQLFTKLNAHDRGEVIARILAGHTARRR
jgi:DNA-binding CsgD family transcriptional regulator